MRQAGLASSRVAWSTVALALVVAALAGGCAAGSSNSTGGAGPADAGYGTGTAGTGSSSTGTAGTSSTGSGGESGSTGTAGASASGTAGTTASAGTSGGTAGTTGTAGTGTLDGGVPAACLVMITSLIPGSFAGLEAGPSSVLRMQASVSNYVGNADGGAVQWLWSVKMAGAASLAIFPWTPVDDAGTTIDVALGTAGTYQIEAHVVGAPSCDRAPLIVTVSPPQTPSFRFRVTPPAATQLPVREMLVTSTDAASGAQSLDLLNDGPSTVVSLTPVDVRNFPLPSYVRITSPAFLFDLEGSTERGALIAPLATSLTYDVLVVPDNGLAPLIVSGTPDSVSTKMAMMAIGPGAAVTGSMRDGDGQAVSGARVALKAGQRPSTVGVSGADGSFTLTTREGTLSAAILAPAGSGLPDAYVTASPGIALAAGATSLDLGMSWAKVPAAALTIKVSTPGGLAVAGAGVRADLATPLSNVGTLTVHGAPDVQLPASGTAHADGVTDALGVVHLGLLPTGTYHVIVAPPEDPASAITLADVVLPAAGTTAAIALAAPVTFLGTLEPLGATAGAKVTAIDRGLLAAATLPTATAAADGTYALALAAGRSYELLVEPSAATTLARAVVDVVTPMSTSAGGSRTQVVPSALLWKGSIKGGGSVVSGALVQVYCAEPASSCLDATLAVAQGTTAPDGTVTLALPNPSP
jgi:hypothetical protein